MSNYNQSDVDGIKWTRASQVKIDNPLGGIASIRFREEDVISSGDDTISTCRGSVGATFKDPQMSFPILDTETGEETGQTMSYQDVYIALHSLYISLARERDASQP